MPFFGLIVLSVLVLAIVDIARAGESGIRGLPRMVWLLIVLLVPLAGSIAWFVAGRPVAAAVRRPNADRGLPEYDRPGRFIPEDPVADAEFLRQCRERADAQRRAAKQIERQQETDESDTD